MKKKSPPLTNKSKRETNNRVDKSAASNVAEKDERLAGVEKLLLKISQSSLVLPATLLDERAERQSKKQVEAEISEEAVEATFIQRELKASRAILPEVFQTLIFKVGKLPLAVPLTKLGGIISVSAQDITPLIGTPKWFMGLVPHERGSLMVIDTCLYLTPEMATERASKEDYQYLILLDDSRWALACHCVGDAKNLTHDDVRWSVKSSSRPWFAGMVIEYMSVLIEVDALINSFVEKISD